MLELYHIGEALVAALLDEAGLQAPVYDLLGETRGTIKGVVDRLLVAGDRQLGIVDSMSLCPLEHDAVTYQFDGMSKVDVLVYGRTSGVPIEVKLGMEQMASGTFASRFLGGCCRSGHGESGRINGDMISILSGGVREMLHDPSIGLRARTPGDDVHLSRNWLLVARRTIFKRWMGRACPAFKTPPLVIVFEDLVHLYGGSARLNVLVQQLVSSEDYFRDWKLGE